jgi:hypothetical protein
MAASGGILMLSDKLPNLSEDQLCLISKLFPVNQTAARPLDLTESYIPGVLDFGVRQGTRTVALINWGDAPRAMRVGNEEAFVWEFWSESFSYHGGGDYEIELSPRSAKVFYFTPVSDAALVGSDACVVMQSEWNADGDMTVGRTLKQGERVFAASKKTLKAASGCDAGALGDKDGFSLYEIRPSANEYTLIWE